MCYLLPAEWEAAKNTEAAKDAVSQSAAGETQAASNSLTETYNQQVAMMPVQVHNFDGRSIDHFTQGCILQK